MIFLIENKRSLTMETPFIQNLFKSQRKYPSHIYIRYNLIVNRVECGYKFIGESAGTDLICIPPIPIYDPRYGLSCRGGMARCPE